MALQTLVWRPVAGSISVTDADDVTSIPNGITSENYYTLLNETVADDDATYISTNYTSTSSYTTITLTGITLPESVAINGEIISLSYNVRLKSSLASTSYEITLQSDSTSVCSALHTLEADIWTSLENTFYSSDFSTIDIYNSLINGTIQLKMPPLTTGTAKNPTYATIDISYIYIEIVYNDGVIVTVPFFIKENNIWAESNGLLYKKAGGDWTMQDSTAFIEDIQYIIIDLDGKGDV